MQEHPFLHSEKERGRRIGNRKEIQTYALLTIVFASFTRGRGGYLEGRGSLLGADMEEKTGNSVAGELPRVVVLLNGKRKAGKDYVVGRLQES